ncbi:hypothetical protein LG047_00225 [Methylocystis sp. WRRC1]|uniref:hypothetical protein n=1 Tax=Methylocystis sp. WRRC1 TaxID=1732014 RepID=UPI001D13C643|nr:hypothetical protein [Methylocystis sp. WRRC1]MCC3243762.1 hypothetical protein [Methylocystis sp. WRRC1]
MSTTTTTTTTTTTGGRYELGQHLDTAADMSRVLWLLLQNDDLFHDPADAAAVRALAGQVEDAAAAARAQFEGQGASGDV